MKLPFLFFSFVLAAASLKAEAQMLSPKPLQAESQIQTEAVPARKPAALEIEPKITGNDVLEQLAGQEEAAPASMTPEQKAAVKKPLVKEIISDVDKSSVRERRELVGILHEFQKIQTRRQNLNLPEDQQIKLEEPRVNPASKEDVWRYMQDKLVAPLDRSMNIR